MVTYHVQYCRMNLRWISIQCTQHTEYYLILQCCVIEHIDHGKRIVAQTCTALYRFPLPSLFFPFIWGLSTVVSLPLTRNNCCQTRIAQPCLGSSAANVQSYAATTLLSLCIYAYTRIYVQVGKQKNSFNPAEICGLGCPQGSINSVLSLFSPGSQ